MPIANANTDDLTNTLLRVRANVLQTAVAARAEGQTAQYQRSPLETLYVYRGPDDEFFFRDHEATELILAAQQCAKLLGIDDVLDVILHDAQGW